MRIPHWAHKTISGRPWHCIQRPLWKAHGAKCVKFDIWGAPIKLFSGNWGLPLKKAEKLGTGPIIHSVRWQQTTSVSIESSKMQSIIFFKKGQNYKFKIIALNNSPFPWVRARQIYCFHLEESVRMPTATIQHIFSPFFTISVFKTSYKIPFQKVPGHYEPNITNLWKHLFSLAAPPPNRIVQSLKAKWSILTNCTITFK